MKIKLPLFALSTLYLISCSANVVERETERNYQSFSVTPNIPEICRAASRPEDAFINYSVNLGAKNGALKALNDRNLECDWSSEMQYWQDFQKTRVASEANNSSESNEVGYFTSKEDFLRGQTHRCNYSDGSFRIVIWGGQCPRTN